MAHSRKALAPLFLFLLASSAITAADPARDLKDGTDLFRNGQYEKAILLFHSVTLDPAATLQEPVAYFLLAKSYMALGRLEEAGENLELFLVQFPSSADHPEALYQKGRLLFMREDFENAIQVLQGFIDAHPRSDFIPSAWFWVGESLYNLGRLDDAREVYGKITKDYPASVKVEAAQYKLSLIELRRTEIELSKLLKWSHEDFLKSIEEYQRREKAYEQVIESYQKKLAESGSTQSQKTISDLRQEIERLSAQVTQLSGAASASAQQEQIAQTERLRRLLAVQQAALALKEQYLRLLGPDGGAAK